MNAGTNKVKRRISSAEAFPSLGEPSQSNGAGGSPAGTSAARRRVRFKEQSPAHVPLGLVVGFGCLMVAVIVFLFWTHSSSPGRAPRPAGPLQRVRKISEKHDKVFVSGCQVPDLSQPRANATFVVLARNKELEGVVQSIRSIERHFNRWYHYPYTFLNDEDFNSTFIEGVRKHASGTVEFGKIDASLWGFPDWVDSDIAAEGIRRQGDAAIMYGGLESYHHMCRFYSGFFYKHPLLQKYEWYWRVEPEVKYFCDITYDPFIKMIENNKTYGFTIAVKELQETVPNLFRYASAYMRNRNITSKGMWEMFTIRPIEDENFFPENDPRYRKTLPTEPRPRGAFPDIDDESMEGEVYNRCHFWSNFEIARLDWFRSSEYEDFFNVMDRSGGFWNERWGDAPIHSLAAGALLSPSQVHYFRDIGYRHTTIQHCPANAPGKQLAIPPYYDDTSVNSFFRMEEGNYWANPDTPRENGVGCRCRCDLDVVEVEGKEGSCSIEWVEIAGGWASP